ncbi:MAG: c-type cytochrome [Candidatus Sulfotelmatobacter sp.]
MAPKLAVARILPLLFLAGFVSFSSPAKADGAAIYKAKCAMCHGADGKGNTPAGKNMGAHDFTSADVKKESDADLIAITSKGKNKMPAYGAKLSEAEIKDVIAYVRQLAK